MKLPFHPAPINHVLRAHSWALERLRPHAGKHVRIDCAPFSNLVGIAISGELAAADDVPGADVTLRLTPGLLLRIAARDASAWHEVKAEGDAEFAAAIDYVARNLRWDIEEDLSKVFGDAAAHRMAETGRTFGRWGQQSADNLARAFAEYWTEERPLIAAKYDIEAFNRDVDALRDDIARIEKRIERLA